MSNHRAPRRGSADVSGTPARAGTSDSTTTPAAGSTVGKRRAVKHSASRGPLFRRFPSAPVLLGIAALTISATGAVSMSDHGVITDTGSNLVAANALTGTTSTSSSSAAEERRQAVSRDSRRDALKDATTKELQAAVEQQAQQRNAELAKLAKSAEKQAAKIALNAWGLPVSSYRLTAGFGQSSGLWANTHTGLDFAAPTGTPIHSVTNGTVTSVGYEGSYGNQVIVTTDEGEELWYCHMNQFASSRRRRGPHRRPPRVRRVHRQHHRPAPAPRGTVPAPATRSTRTTRWSLTASTRSERQRAERWRP